MHGERRSRAVKRERHTGVGPTLEKAEPLHAVVATQEEMKESVSKELLSRATPSETKSAFLAPKPNPLSSADEDKFDAGSELEKENSIPKETVTPKTRIINSTIDFLTRSQKSFISNRSPKVMSRKNQFKFCHTVIYVLNQEVLDGAVHWPVPTA